MNDLQERLDAIMKLTMAERDAAMGQFTDEDMRKLHVLKLNEVMDQTKEPIKNDSLIEEVDERLHIKNIHAFWFHNHRIPCHYVSKTKREGKTLILEFYPGKSIFVDDRPTHRVEYETEEMASQVQQDFWEWASK